MTGPAAQIIDLYERHAHAYAADRGRALVGERPWLDRFTALLAPDAIILDLGCGAAGPIAGHLIDHGFDVVGIDTSPTLVSICRARFPHQDWRVADMRGLALGRRFIGLLAWDSFFHLSHDDQRAMFAVFQAHAAPGAALMFTTGPAQGESIGAYRGDALYHASLAPEEYRDLLAAHGFRVLANVFDDPDCGGHSVWLAQAD